MPSSWFMMADISLDHLAVRSSIAKSPRGRCYVQLTYSPPSGCSIGIKYLAFICRRDLSLLLRLLIYQSFVYITTNSWVFSTLDYNEHYFISFTNGPPGALSFSQRHFGWILPLQEDEKKAVHPSDETEPKTQQLTSDFQISTASVQPTCCPKGLAEIHRSTS